MIAPRTFGDLVALNRVQHCCVHCAFCKKYGDGRKYSARHYICDPCIADRADAVLPSVRKREAFDAKMRQIRS